MDRKRQAPRLFLFGASALVAVALAVAGAAAAAGAATPKQDLPTARALSSELQYQIDDIDEDSEPIYAEQCAACHGADGEGGVGPAFTESTLTLPERVDLITEGRGGMPGFDATLTADQIAAMASFLDTFVAQEIYRQQCAPCHGADGEGGIGPGLQQSNLTDAEALDIIGQGQGAMPAFGPTLTADQLAAVTDFTVGLRSIEAIGEQVYVEQCAPCHGLEGEGGVGTNLQTSVLPRQELSTLITEGRGGMPAFAATLGPEEIEGVADYVAGLRAATEEPSAAEAGAELFSQHCAACHGADGSGGTGPSLTESDLSFSEMVLLVAEGRGPMPRFSETLSGDEIQAVATYTAGLEPAEIAQPEPAGAELYSQQCAGCHAADGSGGVGPSLQTAALSNEELLALVSDGAGSMPGFAATLTDDEIQALIAYVRESLVVEVEEGAAGPTGQELFEAECAPCHGVQGEGGIGPSLRESDLSVNHVISQIFGGHGPEMPAFEGELDSGQVQAVAQYVLSLRDVAQPDEGGGVGLFVIVAVIVGAVVVISAGLAWLRTQKRDRSDSDVQV